ncbi:hypothetical protein [Prevotella nigrescens]|jgi:hypothetical protein|uniref:Uncharacterized protein n=1 Tax=Prevotella nigrescens CC14M TaxID=1073366 RepID=V8CNV0_9BACT|nr:hypothetical protein [Prevotella nigrescens]ETD28705.1 hypothetical protein HMPREF1173_01197 [Prevotella nigrescens CC14M]
MTQRNILPYKIKALVVWLQRMKHIQGFGIQSPSAFSFDRKVINDHTPYPVYAELKRVGNTLTAVERKKARLLYRINRFAEADRFCFYPTKLLAYESYIKAACERTLVEEAKMLGEEGEGTASDESAIYFLTVGEHCQAFYERLRTSINAQSFVIVDDIKRNAETRAFWQQIVDDERVSFSFDLYHIGIAFFDKRPKQNYIINF